MLSWPLKLLLADPFTAGAGGRSNLLDGAQGPEYVPDQIQMDVINELYDSDLCCLDELASEPLRRGVPRSAWTSDGGDA